LRIFLKHSQGPFSAKNICCPHNDLKGERHALSARLLLLAGCADARRGPETFDAARYEPTCARQCLDGYNRCISGMSGISGSIATAQMQACDLNSRQCLSTCPAK
jgi:hypothetical protein